MSEPSFFLFLSFFSILKKCVRFFTWNCFSLFLLAVCLPKSFFLNSSYAPNWFLKRRWLSLVHLSAAFYVSLFLFRWLCERFSHTLANCLKLLVPLGGVVRSQVSLSFFYSVSMLLSYSNHFRGLRERERQRFDDIKKSRARLRGSGWNGLATWRSWNNIRHLCRRFLFPPLFFIEIVSGIVIPPPPLFILFQTRETTKK